MATIWKGSLAFGLVNLPVELKAAVRADHISFRMLHEEDMAPVKYERVCSRTGEVVPWKEIVKGYEYTKGKFVVLTDDDFKAAALESSKAIDILDFVRTAEIDPRYFETPYYLVPTKGGEKPYALLREAMRNSDVIGIGKIIMRQKQHLAGIRVVGDALVLELMRFANELVNDEELRFPDASTVREQELRMAEQLVENLAEPFDPSKYTDDYRASLMKVIKAKLAGKKIRVEEPEDDVDDTKVLDLMSRLQASLDEVEGRASKRPRRERAAKRAPARTKTAASRAKSEATGATKAGAKAARGTTSKRRRTA